MRSKIELMEHTLVQEVHNTKTVFSEALDEAMFDAETLDTNPWSMLLALLHQADALLDTMSWQTNANAGARVRIRQALERLDRTEDSVFAAIIAQGGTPVFPHEAGN